MKKYLVSIDFTEVAPISYASLLSRAFDPGTPDEYADYLKSVLENAARILPSIGRQIETVEFGMHATGCIVPFGEGSTHPYSRHFYTWMDLPFAFT